MRVLIGTSGWQYRDWRGRFYPVGLPTAEWLAYYASQFPTVEVNNSFYRLPTEETFDRWRRATPEGFVMAVKASRFLTHLRRLRDPAEPLELLLSRARALGSRLGPVLFQLPPRFPVDLPRLEALTALLPGDVRAAFEFRDPSWDRDDVRAALDRVGAAWVLADRPGAHVRDHVTGGWAYLRFHQGRPNAPGYARDKLRRWADRIAALPASDAYVYFNNDAGAAAVHDARVLAELVAARV
jgi:uncharacterized protein YecE (DUF72 family)